MDLEAYIGRYRGQTRLQRLLHIGQTTPDMTLAAAAYQMAEQQMRRDGNVVRYKEVFAGAAGGEDTATPMSTSSAGSSPHDHHHHSSSRHNIVFDHDFVMETEVHNRATRDTLSGRLSTAQSHLNKEAIRTAYLALAEADVLRGDLTEAYHAALRAKDYCTNRQQTAQVSFLILELAIHLQNYSQVKDYCYKVQHTLLPSSSAAAASAAQESAMPNIADKLLVASALERLAYGDYAEAASKFRQVCCHPRSNGGGSTAGGGGVAVEWDTLIAPEDIATYAAITSLATASRPVLMGLVEHPEALELVPPLKDAMFQLAARANYKQAWHILQQLQPTLALDLFLAPHLPHLLQQIREACILEYWIPYQRVQLDKMAHDLDLSLPDLTQLVEQLMLRGAMYDCRMDCRTHCLMRESNLVGDDDTAALGMIRDGGTSLSATARIGGTEKPVPHTPAMTRRRMKYLGRQVLDDTYAMIIRLACEENDLVVADPQQNKGERRGQRGVAVGDAFGDGSVGIDDDTSDDDEDTPMVDAMANDQASMLDIAHNQAAMIGDEDENQANPEDLY